ncbi:MAG: GTP-binding protein [Alphaproteobacteria bacterium]|nr:GTP-binding protein [Alphaproteobacteria bacterium]
MTPATRIPVAVLTGFLGSGKTTLLNSLLRDPGMAGAAVIVNEFGEIGLDHLLIRSADENVVLLDSGCLCCTINNTLRETLTELYVGRVRGELPAFDRVLVETTGLADPGPILQVITTDLFATEHYALDGVVVTVDAVHADHQLDTAPEAAKQVAVADRLVLTKTDLADAATVARLRARLARLNPAAPMVSAVRGELAPDQVLGAGLYDPSARTLAVTRWLATDAYHDHGGSHAPDVNRHDAHIRAHCFFLDEPASWAGLAAWCELMGATHGDKLLRVKGLIEIVEIGRPVVIHGVHRLFDRPVPLSDWPDADRRSRLVVIARDLERGYVEATLKVLSLPPGSGRPLSLAEVVPS